MAVERHLIELCHEAVAEAFAQSDQPVDFPAHFLKTKFTRFAKADDERYWQSTAAQAALMAAAVQQRRRANTRVTGADIESAHSFGAINLVGREAHEVDAH